MPSMVIAPTPLDTATAMVAIHHSIARWVDTFAEVMSAKGNAITALRQPDGRWELLFGLLRADLYRCTSSVAFNADGPAIVAGNELVRWGVRRIGPGVWVLDPSISILDHFHAYVVFHDVPEPAPWLR